MDTPLACLTLDLENDWSFDEPGYDHLTFEYVDEYVSLIEALDVPVSVFVVGRTLERFPEVVERLRTDLDAEFHLHSYSHDLSGDAVLETELRRGADAFADFFGRDPEGYRAPQGRLDPAELATVADHGFELDSSIFPAYRPGVYDNRDVPLEPHRPETAPDLVELPVAADPRFRIPITQSYLKLLGRPYLAYLKRTRLPDVLVFDSHLQDFYRTASHDNLPWHLQLAHKRNLGRSVDLFRAFVSHLRDRGYRFTTVSAAAERADCAGVGLE